MSGVDKGASASQTGPSQVEPVPVSPLRASVPSAIVLIRADDPEMKPQLYACPKCGSVNSPRIYACRDDLAHETARRAAEECYNCKEYNLCACGEKCPKHWTSCEACRLAKRLEDAVEVPDNGGPYFGFDSDRMYHELEEAADDGHEWVWPSNVMYPKIDPDSVLENLYDEMFEDAGVDDLVGVDAFYEAVKAFNEAQTTRTYWADMKRRIRVPAQAIEARQGGNGVAGAVHESAVPEGNAP